MKYLFDHDLHTHSYISLCSGDSSQTSERILGYAENNKLKTLCLTNHFWDENVCGGDIDFYKKQNFAHVADAKPLPEKDGVKFLFGCETDMNKHLRIGISQNSFEKFDFVIIPTTHFQLSGFTIPDTVKTPKDKAECWIERFNAVLDMDLPFRKIGIAHLTCRLMDSCVENYLEILTLLQDSDLNYLFEKAAKNGVGIELNARDMKFLESEAEIVLRPYKIAKSKGCKFYLGSDAHHPHELISAKPYFERCIDKLNLTEDDKFTIGCKN